MPKERTSTLAAAAALLLSSASLASAAGNPWLDDGDIQLLHRQPARTAALIQRCDKDIDSAASPLADLAPPPHYSASGVVHTESGKYFSQDGRRAFRAGLCYAISQDPRYAKYAQATISAWGDTLRAVSTPQGVAEINFNLAYNVLAASMVRGVNDWNDASFRHLLTTVVPPLQSSNNRNNHANWHVFRDASIAAYLGDAALMERTRKHWLDLMDKQVAADGSLPLEICRSDTSNYCGGPTQGINGMSYTHYTLTPTVAAAHIFELEGQAVWQTPQGAKLASAYRKAAAWTLHPETFPYYASNAGKLNGLNGTGYFVVLQGHYPNEDGARVISGRKLPMDALDWLLAFGG